MNAYRQQQLRAARLIEQGATVDQVSAVYGWIRGEPELIEQPKPKRKSKLLRILCRLLK